MKLLHASCSSGRPYLQYIHKSFLASLLAEYMVAITHAQHSLSSFLQSLLSSAHVPAPFLCHATACNVFGAGSMEQPFHGRSRMNGAYIGRSLVTSVPSSSLHLRCHSPVHSLLVLIPRSTTNCPSSLFHQPTIISNSLKHIYNHHGTPTHPNPPTNQGCHLL